MSTRKGIRVTDKSGKQAYAISHSNKIFYPDKKSPTGLSTLTQALGAGHFKFESNVDLSNDPDIGEPIVDPIVKDYIDRVLSAYITEVFNIKSSDWVYDSELERYKIEIHYPGMRAGVYPSFGLIPSDLLPNDLEVTEFNRIDCIVGQEDVILFIAKDYPKTTLNVVVRGISDYGGKDANLEIVEEKIEELKTLLEESKPEYFNATLYYNEWTNSKTIEVSNTNITLDSYVEVYMDPSITEEQYKELLAASIVASSIGDGSVTLKCLGTKPTINIPVILKITK